MNKNMDFYQTAELIPTRILAFSQPMHFSAGHKITSKQHMTIENRQLCSPIDIFYIVLNNLKLTHLWIFVNGESKYQMFFEILQLFNGYTIIKNFRL